jgi:hypothetical protein
MVRARKKNQGISLYPQDWARMKANLETDELLIEFIEKAIVRECEIREGLARRPMRMSPLTEGIPSH